MKPPAFPVWLQFLRWFFALLLISTASGKLLNMPGFIGVVDSYQVLPGVLLWPAAVALTLTELALGLWLMVATRVSITGLRNLEWAARGVVALHLMYLAWLLPAWVRGLELPNCGCFGVYFPRPLTGQTLIEDSVLLAAALGLWLALRGKGPSAR